MKRNRVVHFKEGPYLALTENWIYERLRYLERYEPVFYCHSIENRESFPLNSLRAFGLDGVEGRVRQFVMKAVRRLRIAAALVEDKPDILHAHYGSAGYHALALRGGRCIPLLTTFYGYDVHRLPKKEPVWQKRYRKLFERGDCFLVEGRHMKKCLVDLGCCEEKVVVLKMGIDLGRFPARPREIRDDEAVCILIAASFREKKGIPYAVDAVGHLMKRFPRKRFRLTIIGDSGGSQEEEREKRRILEMIAKHGMKSSVRMPGYLGRPGFVEALYSHHLFLSPSVSAASGDTEGGAPVAIIEAAASGMPVIATTHCDIPEIVENERTGFLAPERDVEALARAMEKLIMREGLCRRMGGEAARKIEREHDGRIQSGKLEDIYDNLLRREPCGGKRRTANARERVEAV